MEQDKSQSESISQQSQAPTSGVLKRFSKKQLLIVGSFVLIFLAIGLGLFFGSSSKQSDNTQQDEQAQTTEQDIANLPETVIPSAANQTGEQTLVYGAWTGQESVIRLLNLTTSETTTLASLPLEIKKITVLPDRSLLYIDQTDIRDHGKQISLYDLKTKATTVTIPAAKGFGIDDYVLSPDKKFLAIWEVSFAQGSEVLREGRSRVYTVNLSRPTVKNLLYDEVATEPVHYPRAILNDGTVFTDRFLPNDPNGGAGWAYGMSISSFDGTTQKDIDIMKAGTYGTQPSLSPDGKYLLFAGYDGKFGDGTAVKDGFRQAILTPNTVNLLDTQTLQRYTFPNLSNDSSYTTAYWDISTGRVMLTIIGTSADSTGLYTYDLASRSLQRITIPSINNREYMPITSITDKKILIGSFEDNASNLGNLGASYEYAYNKLASFDAQSSKSEPITVEDAYAQYITLLPSDYFKAVLGIKTIAQANPQPTFVDLYSDESDAKKNVQLYTFFLKYDLQPVRLKQQSDPLPPPPQSDLSKITLTPNTHSAPPNDDNQSKCNDVAAKQCAAKGQGPDSEVPGAWLRCKGQYKAQNMNRTCDDSPLYLYGQSGQQIRVTINTPVYNAIPSYTNGYTVTLLTNGKMKINNNTYERIAYDYSSNLRRTKAPKEGTITSREDAATVLKEYAHKLGLNEKETADLVRAGKQKITSPYAFISFFDHKTSHAILPIIFSPEPDNYLNVVFYFKLLEHKPLYTPLPPVFPDPVKRDGFTAIEVSEMIE